jgi:hypothetical protein
MAIRERLKKTFSRNSASGAGSEDSSSAGSNVYKPGEKMPQSKYRRPVAKEHKEKLEAFSFANAWRRKSNGSTYSPMGSRMPSRKNSAEPQVGRRSRSFVQPVSEGDNDDTDVANVGASHHHTTDQPPSSRKPGEPPLALTKAKDFAASDSESHNANGVRHDTPFASDELTQRLSHLAIPSTS